MFGGIYILGLSILTIVAYSTSTSYMLPSHLTTIAREGSCIRKRENDRKVRSIVDRKPVKIVVLANACSTGPTL